MKLLVTTLFFAFAACNLSMGQDLVYRPINPAFGGDTFNYQWLLSSAEAQNKFTEDESVGNEQSDLERFTESLNNQLRLGFDLLSRLHELSMKVVYQIQIEFADLYSLLF